MDRVPDTAQHFIECDTESCRNFSDFYCNICHQRICDQCREVHLKECAGREIVRYQDRKRKLPSEKCKIHPTQDIDVYCKVCQDPFCSICLAHHHSDHEKIDLETIYNEILQQCKKNIINIWETVIPGAKDNIKLIGEKSDNVKKEIAKFRVFMKKRADEIKMAIDSILTDNNKKLDEIENSVLNDMAEHQRETDDYKNHLDKIVADYESKISSITYTEVMKFQLDISLASLKMPSKSEPKLPTLTLGTLNKEEIAKLLGDIDFESSERFELSSVKKVNQLTIPGAFHLSPLPPIKFWARNSLGNLIQYDMEGNILHIISTSISNIRGNQTVTTEGELLYTDYRENTVYRVTSDKSTNRLIQTGSWEPGAIFSSPINGHLLVGMKRKSDQKITRYSREGRKLQDIQLDDKGQTLYQGIGYITENINGDVCTSDYTASRVVVVTASGEFRFSYSGHEFQYGFWPHGICTDVLGHILVCDSYKKNCSSIHLLDINGQFLSILLTSEQCPPRSRALCIDDQHNFWVAGLDSYTVFVYKYLQTSKK